MESRWHSWRHVRWQSYDSEFKICSDHEEIRFSGSFRCWPPTMTTTMSTTATMSLTDTMSAVSATTTMSIFYDDDKVEQTSNKEYAKGHLNIVISLPPPSLMRYPLEYVDLALYHLQQEGIHPVEWRSLLYIRMNVPLIFRVCCSAT